MIGQRLEQRAQRGQSAPGRTDDNHVDLAHRTFRKIFSGPFSCSYLSS
jgi:hypothetical protein